MVIAALSVSSSFSRLANQSDVDVTVKSIRRGDDVAPQGQQQPGEYRHGLQDADYRNARHRASDRAGWDAERRLCRHGYARGVSRRPWNIARADHASPRRPEIRTPLLTLQDRQAVRGDTA